MKGSSKTMPEPEDEEKPKSREIVPKMFKIIISSHTFMNCKKRENRRIVPETVLEREH